MHTIITYKYAFFVDLAGIYGTYHWLKMKSISYVNVPDILNIVKSYSIKQETRIRYLKILII